MSTQDPAADDPPDPRFTDPVDVSNHLLEVTRRAYLSLDFGMYRPRFILPQILGTFEGERLIETPEDLRRVFDATCRSFAAEGVIDIYRRTLSAEFLDPMTMRATYSSAYVLRGHILTEDTLAHGTAHLVDGLWRIAESQYATRDRPGIRSVSARSF